MALFPQGASPEVGSHTVHGTSALSLLGWKGNEENHLQRALSVGNSSVRVGQSRSRHFGSLQQNST